MYFRKRKSGSDGCNCGDGKQEAGSAAGTIGGPDHLEMKPCSEVYDNPNYSHIMIGGKPFFILPTGELSEHVPVPAEGEQHTPRHNPPATAAASQHHIYEGGSSTYRSGSDYDTESSTYRPDSDRASNGFPPIYEEIDKCSTAGGGGSNRNSTVESHFMGKSSGGSPPSSNLPSGEPAAGKGFLPHHQTMAVIRKEESSPQTVLHPDRGGHWSSTAGGHKSLSPRRPVTRLPNRTPDSSGSVYYYSDTLRRRGLLDSGGRDSVQESDSGVSCRSGHNTSSESTPQPRLELGRRTAGGGARHGPPAVVSSDEDLSQDLHLHQRRAAVGLHDNSGVNSRTFGGSPVRFHDPTAAGSPLPPVNRRQEANSGGGGPFHRGLRSPVDTQIIVRNTSKREPRVNL